MCKNHYSFIEIYQKWTDPFCTSQAGLLARLQKRLRVHTPGCSAKLDPKVPSIP